MSVQPSVLPVPGFPGYFASPDGRVFSERPWRGSSERRELVGGVGSHGYRSVVLCDGAHRRAREVHVIVAETFHGPRPAGMDVCHLDGDKTNNAADNLRFGTRGDNLRDAVLHGTHYNAKKTHCPQRHPYDERNTYVNRQGNRECRACGRANKRAQRERQMLAAANVPGVDRGAA